MPPSWAIAMAVFDSVTVSMAALTNGILSEIRSVNRVMMLVSAGSTDDSAGINKTSSKVRPTGKTSCSNIFHLLTRLKKTQTEAWVWDEMIAKCKHKVL